MKAVRFDRYGELDVLQVIQVERPVPGPGEVLVQVKAAGINPGESAIHSGPPSKQFPATFPSGQGSDFAGIVTELGEGVEPFEIGDEVLGFSDKRASQAEFVAVGAQQLVRRPSNVPWEVAGSMFIAATTAYAAFRAVSVSNADAVGVSGAAGGVGSVAVQLAKAAGAHVVGIASEANHSWLSSHGVVGVAYGDGLAARVRHAATRSIDAFIDTFGAGYVELALELGVKPERIDTIIDYAAAAKYKVKTAASADAHDAATLAKLVGLVSEGRLEIPIAKVYPLERVRDAYRELERRHTRGKIVLLP